MKRTFECRFTPLLVLILSIAAGSALAKSQKPNILVVWGDDVGQSNISTFTHGLMG